MDVMNWNRGLAMAAMLISIGGMAVVSGRTARDRFFAIGVITQGIVVAFAVSSAYHGRSELGAVAIALLFVSFLWCLWDRDHSPEITCDSESTPQSVDLGRRDTVLSSSNQEMVATQTALSPASDLSKDAR